MNTQQKTAHTVFAVPWWRIANPANWPLLLGLGLLRLLTLLPVSAQQVVGAGLGRGFELLGASYCRCAGEGTIIFPSTELPLPTPLMKQANLIAWTDTANSDGKLVSFQQLTVLQRPRILF